MEQFLQYFCGAAANSQGSVETEPLRISFYKSVATFVRAYAEIAQDLTTAGYSDADAAALQKEVEFYGDIRVGIKRHSGEELDIKPYEADMRRLINTYVQADPAADAGNFSSLTDLTIKTGIHDAIARKLNQKGKLLIAADSKVVGGIRDFLGPLLASFQAKSQVPKNWRPKQGWL